MGRRFAAVTRLIRGVRRCSPRRLGLGALLAAVLVAGLPAAARAADGPLVAAAADLNYALADIAGRFTADTGVKVRFSFGSSGNFARQIAQGAAFDLFMSADEGYVRFLAKRGLTEGDGVLYAIGRLVLFAPKGSPVVPDPAFDGLRSALQAGRVQRFAIANPEHAPYGRAAREALKSAGLWDSIRSHLVLGENASQATQFAISGSTQGGLIPYSQALVPRVSARGTYALVPAAWHKPLRQRMVLLKGAAAGARRFYDYLRSPPARAILARYGFAVPADQR